MLCNSILDAIGQTPLVRLQRIVQPGWAEILVKNEALEVGGSIKTRSAYAMVKGAIERGELKAGSTIVEPTSGNQGIGLSLVGAVLGFKVHIVMPDSVSSERRALCMAYGASVELVPDEGDIGACIDECLARATAYRDEDPATRWMPQQFVNPDNPLVHRETTGREILEQAGGAVDGFVSGIGTGGTISGVGAALREANPTTVIWAVEPTQAAILSGGAIGTHQQMGIGDGLIPDNLDTDIYDAVVTVSDEEAVAMARRLAAEEGLLTGISSGTNVVAACRLAEQLGEGKRVVAILPDTAERYFSTVLFSREEA